MLGVNVDHVATLRQARGTHYPDPLQAAKSAESAGADAITIHLREDRRHINDRDVEVINAAIDCRLNLEMAVTEEMLNIAERIKPSDCCLVPEKREELTTEGGLNVVAKLGIIDQACERLSNAGVRVSLFIDPELDQIDAAIRAGAPVIELHTGCYADAEDDNSRELELERIKKAVSYASKQGLQVNAGHGLTLENVIPIATLRDIRELNIGHSIISRAIFVGLEQAVKEMLSAMSDARRA